MKTIAWLGFPSLAFVASCTTTRAGAGPVGVSVPGFDTRDYPGDTVMRRWRAESPYRWVGYYLPSPCFTGRTWVGKRSVLHDMSWGFALIFVGEQDWDVSRVAQSAAPLEFTPPRPLRAGALCAFGKCR